MPPQTAQPGADTETRVAVIPGVGKITVNGIPKGMSDEDFKTQFKTRHPEYFTGQQQPQQAKQPGGMTPPPAALPSAEPTPTPQDQALPENESTGFWNWFFGRGKQYEHKGLVETALNKVDEIAINEGRKRLDYRMSNEYYNSVQANYKAQMDHIEQSKEPESSKRQLRQLIEEERQQRLYGQADVMIEQFAPNAVPEATKILRGMLMPSKTNLALGATAAIVPPSRPFIGAYFAATSLYDALRPRNDDPNSEEYESDADYASRVLSNLAGAAGGAALMASPRRFSKGERRYRLNKATFAANGGNPEFAATIDDLDQTLITNRNKVNKVGDVLNLVKDTERRLNSRFEQALFPLRGVKMVPTQVADALWEKAGQPNLRKTPDGRREAHMYRQAAISFQRQWSLEELDLERRRMFDARLAKKGSVQQSISKRANVQTDIDQIIEDNIRELEYNQLNAAYPNQNFNDLKFRQSKLVSLKQTLEERIPKLQNAQAIQKGAPALMQEKATGSVSKHGFFGRVYAKIPGAGPERVADVAARKAFKRPGPGRPLPPLGQPQFQTPTPITKPPAHMTPPPVIPEKPDPAVISSFGEDSVERYNDLKRQWAETNNNLLKYIDNPRSPEALAATKRMKELSTQINAMHVNEGVGTPGAIRDVVIVGAGPGGLAAATMAAADGLNVTFIDANATVGGQAKYSSRIENYPGFPVGVSGANLASQMYEQATRLGANSVLGQRVTKLEHDPATGYKTLTLENGQRIQGRSVIVAGGLEFKKLNFPGSDLSGIIYGNSQEITRLGAGKSVVILGGSNGAAQAALGAAERAREVYVISRSPVAKGMSDYQVRALSAHPNITVIEGDEIAKLEGDAHKNPMELTTKGGKVIPANAVGVFVGSAPNTGWLPEAVTRREGKIVVNGDLETPIPGVFAIGDIREGAIGRVGFAVGDGQMAERNAVPYLQRAFPKKGGTPEAPPEVKPSNTPGGKKSVTPTAKAAATATAPRSVSVEAKPTDIQSFANTVNDAAYELAGQGVHPHGIGDKVFIADIYDHLRPQLGKMTLEEFKQKVQEARQKGLLQPAAADQAHLYPPQHQRKNARSATGGEHSVSFITSPGGTTK